MTGGGRNRAYYKVPARPVSGAGDINPLGCDEEDSFRFADDSLETSVHPRPNALRYPPNIEIWRYHLRYALGFGVAHLDSLRNRPAIM